MVWWFIFGWVAGFLGCLLFLEHIGRKIEQQEQERNDGNADAQG